MPARCYSSGMSSDAGGEHSLFEDFLSGKLEPVAAASGAAVVPPPSEDELAHQRIIGNLRRILTHQLRSESCTVLPAGTAVRGTGNVGEITYTPDLVVDAQEWDGTSAIARQPLVVFEVAIPGSERADFIGKWQIHRAAPTVGVHVFVDQEGVVITVRRRRGDHWEEESLADADDQIFLPTIHALVSLAEVYADAPPGGDESVDFGNVTLS